MGTPDAAALIKWSSAAALTVGVGVAGWLSYGHAVDVAEWIGVHGAAAYLYPVTIDGLIYIASMVLLDAARRAERAPALARWILGLGIGATLAANLLAGIPYGTGLRAAARLWWFAWPAPVVILMYELLMLMIRRRARIVQGAQTAHAEPSFTAPKHEAPQPAPAAAVAPMKIQRGRAPGRRAAPASMNGGARA